MRIAIDLRSLQGGQFSGVENYTYNVIESLLELDHKNQYVFFSGGLKNFVQKYFTYVNASFRHVKLPNKFLNIAFASGFRKLEDFVGDIDCVFMPNLNQFSLKPKTKLVLTVHDLSPVVTPEFYDLKRRVWHSFLRYGRSFSRANAILAVSHHTKKDLIDLFGIAAEKIHVVYPGINLYLDNAMDDSWFLRSVRNKYLLPPRYLLFLNTIEPRKNLDGLIRAFETLEEDVHLVIAGRPGWKYKELLSKIKESPKAKLIRYLGFVPEKEKSALIKMAEVLVYPSFYEGFGFQPLEAAALGVPSIVSNITSLPEILGNEALTVNPYNPEEIAWGLKEMLLNQTLRKEIAERAFLKLNHYDWKKSAMQILSIIEAG